MSITSIFGKWFSKRTSHPLELQEQVELEQHIAWIMNHFGCRLDHPVDFWLERPKEVSSFESAPEEHLPVLKELIADSLPFSCVDVKFVIADDEEEDLVRPETIPENLQVIFIRQLQLRDIEDVISQIATNLTGYYLDSLDAPNELLLDSPLLPELIGAFFGFAVPMANSSFKSASWNDGNYGYFSYFRPRNVPARIFGVLLGYRLLDQPTLAIDISEQLHVDARGPLRQFLAQAQQTTDFLTDQSHHVYGEKNLTVLAKHLSNESPVRRLAALTAINNFAFKDKDNFDPEQLPTEQLLNLLDERTEQMRYTAGKLLILGNNLNVDSLNRIANLLSDPSEQIRRLGLELLLTHSDKSPNDHYCLARLLRDPSLEVAITAAITMIELEVDDDRLGKMFLPIFRRALQTLDTETVDSIYQALERAAGDSTKEMLEEYLDEEELRSLAALMG